MAVITSGATDIEIRAADNSWIPLQLQVTTDSDGNVLEKTIQELLAASNSDAPLSDTLEALVQESWIRGVGLDYDWAPGVDTRDPEHICPAGEAVDVALPGGGAGGISAMAEYDDDLYLAQIGNGTAGTARILKIDGTTGVVSIEVTLGAGEYMRGLTVADNGSGTTGLYAMSSNGGTQEGRIHRLLAGIWSSTPAYPDAASFGTNGRGPTFRVSWRGRDGIKNNTMGTKSGPKKFSYLKPNGNPMTPADWIEGVPVGTAYEITQFAASRGHVFIGAKDNVFDLDEVGNTPGITSWLEQNIQAGNGDCLQYLDGRLFYSTGYGLAMINVESDGVLEEQPGRCEPGAFLPVEGCPRGPVTAMTVDQGWLVAAVFDTRSGGLSPRSTSVFWGKPAATLGIESPNPMIWHGPMLLLTNNERATAMRCWSGVGGYRLWVATAEDSTQVPRLTRLSLPQAGTTMQDQMGSGPHRVTTGDIGGTLQPFSRLYGLPTTEKDKASRKDLYQVTIGSRGLSASPVSRVTVYTRADPTPGSTSWGAGTIIEAGPIETITQPSITSGYVLQYRLDFRTVNGGATPPVIPYVDSLRATYWRIAPSVDAWTVTVAYGDGVLNLHNGRDDAMSPDQKTALIQDVLGERTVIRDRQDRRRNVRLYQFFPREVTLGEIGPYGKVVVAQLRLADLGPVA
jgi:hypothetical protein